MGADCVSGVCTENGACASGASTNTDATSPPDATPSGEGGVNVTDAGPQESDSGPGCKPNKDGVITRDEVPVFAGLRATYRVAEDVDVSTAGTTAPDGSRVWDFSGPLTNDTTTIVETLPLTDKWYAPKFSGATYAARLRASSDLIGVFEASPGSIGLRGVVSPDDGTYRTELTNDPSVSLVTFPLKMDATWTSTTTVSGVATGVPVGYTEKYESQVDAHGTLKTPLGTFDVLRVRTLLTRTIGWSVTKVRTFAFVTECYGTIATITSKDNESDVEFTRALEIRRIAP